MKSPYIITIMFSLLLACFLLPTDSHSMSYFLGKKVKEVVKEDKAIVKEFVKGVKEEVKKEVVKKSAKAAEETAKNGENSFFMGDEDDDEEIDVEEEEDLETSEYRAARDKLFVAPILKLGTKPLKLTLEDCIRIALVNNNKVQATEYGIDGARAKYSEAAARFYPVFEYEWLSAPVPRDASHAARDFFAGQWSWFNKFRIALGLPLYSFGKLGLAQDLATGGIAAARAERTKERISTVTQVRQLYYGVLLAEELGKLLIKAHSKLSKKMGETDDGVEDPIDKIKAKVFLVDLEKRLAETRDKEMLALEGLRIQMGLSPDVAVMVYSEKLRPMRTALKPIEDYMENALKNRPDVKLVEIGLDVRRNQYRLEKRKILPDIGVGGYFDIGRTTSKIANVNTVDDFQNPFNFTRAGIGMRLEGKLDVHGQSARVKKAKSDYYKASLEHYMAKDGIGLEIKKAYMDAVTSFDNVRRTDKAQKYSRQLLFLTQSNYELGVGEEDEYIEALQLVLLTRGRYFEAVFNYNVALAILDEKAGIIPEVRR